MGDLEDQREKRGERVVSEILGYKGDDEFERDGEGGVEDEALCLCMFITTWYGGYVSSESGSLRQLATRLPDLPSIEVSAQAPVLAPLVPMRGSGRSPSPYIRHRSTKLLYCIAQNPLRIQ